MKNMNRIIEKILPFTVISSNNVNAKTPGYLKEIIRFTTKNKVFVIGKKIKNINNFSIKYKI
jgi:hypothetical protein